MDVCKDLSFLNGLKCNQFNTIKEQFFSSCFPGIKTWLSNVFKSDNYNNILVKNALHQYRISNGMIPIFSLIDEEEINKAMITTNLSDISNELVIIYTKYFYIYYDGLPRPTSFNPTFYENNIHGRVRYITLGFYSNIKKINNYTIYDRLKIKIVELSDIINNDHSELNLHKIILKKIYINAIINTINNLHKYVIDKNVRITSNFEDLKRKKPVHKDSTVSIEEIQRQNKEVAEFNKIIDTEKLINSYPIIDQNHYELSIKQINNENHTALISFAIHSESENLVFNESDTWINLEYLKVI